MVLVHRVRRRKYGDDDFLPTLAAIQTPAESEPYAPNSAKGAESNAEGAAA